MNEKQEKIRKKSILDRKKKAYLKKLGAHIKKIRQQQDYTQDRLYLEADFSRANMSRIESGKVDVQIYTLKRIAIIIGVPVWKLVDFD